MKAGNDLRTAESVLRVSPPIADTACFHAQQCAEKYLKAFLQETGHPIPKTHILMDLLALCIKIEPAFQIIRADLNILEGYAVHFRYPGESADKSEAQTAFKTASNARDFIRHQLGLE